MRNRTKFYLSSVLMLASFEFGCSKEATEESTEPAPADLPNTDMFQAFPPRHPLTIFSFFPFSHQRSKFPYRQI
jgi:hypothetical protein